MTAADDLPREAGDHRPVTQRVLRLVSHGAGKEMAAQLQSRDKRLDQLEEAVRGLVKALETRR